PEVAAASNLLGLRVDGNSTATVEGTDVGSALLIQRQVPTDDRAAPVAKDAGEGLAPVAPIRQVVFRRQVRTAFCPEHFRIGMRLVDLAHHLRGADVSVP